MTKKTVIIPCVAIALLIAAFVGTRVSIEPVREPEEPTPHIPTFDEYQVADLYEGPIPMPNFGSFPAAREFRSAIIAAIAGGVNYAGHYVIASWGCGTSCQNHAIIDATTGAVIHFGLISSYGLDFRPDSRLIVANPESMEGIPAIVGTEPAYYALNQKNDLVFIGKTLRNGDLVCTRAVAARSLKIADSTEKEFEPCLVEDGFVVMDMVPEKSVNFVSEGEVFVENGEKVFKYESSGTPASLSLAFNGASECFVTTEGIFPCTDDIFSVAVPARLEGFRSNGTVTVWLLELKR